VQLSARVDRRAVDHQFPLVDFFARRDAENYLGAVGEGVTKHEYPSRLLQLPHGACVASRETRLFIGRTSPRSVRGIEPDVSGLGNGGRFDLQPRRVVYGAR